MTARWGQKFRHAVRKDVRFDVDDSAFARIRFENDATLMKMLDAVCKSSATGREVRIR